MLERKKYQALNKLADKNGIVLFGGTSDIEIPICELRQAFSIEQNIYNRSFPKISLDNAIELYDTYVAPLMPETILLHLGEADLHFFSESPSEFAQKYCLLLDHIRQSNKRCRIAIVSLSNTQNDPEIAMINIHLKHISDAGRCEYCDITPRKVWNPKNTMETMSFLYHTGFIRPLKTKRPLYDLIKIFYGYNI